VLGAVHLWEICCLAVILELNNAFETPSRQAMSTNQGLSVTAVDAA